MEEKLAWRKAKASGGQGGNCVEVAIGKGVVLIRDSKNPDGHRLKVSPGQFSKFLQDVSAK